MAISAGVAREGKMWRRKLVVILQLLAATGQLTGGRSTLPLSSQEQSSPSKMPPNEVEAGRPQELVRLGNQDRWRRQAEESEVQSSVVIVLGGANESETELMTSANVTATSTQLEQQVLDLDAFQAAREGYFRHSASVSVILTVAYTIVFVVGIIGNSFVVAIVCKSPRMRTVTNFFIANLAFADILVLLFCLPATLVGNLFIPYVLGLFVCKTVSYLQGVAVSASINTMVAVTIDRFLAICFPMDWHMSRRTARWTIASIWLFSLSISLPWAVFFTLVPYSLNHQHTIHVCAEDWPSERWGTTYFVVANLILLYLFPLVAITVCYLGIWYKIERRNIPGERSRGLKIELIMQRSKLKVVKMMMVVVVIFLLSWLPLYLIFARIKLAEERSQWEEALITKMMPLAQWLGASNSCINPILYTFFNRKYKRGFIDLLRYGLCCGPKRKTESQIEAVCAGDGANGSAGCPTSSHNQSNQINNNFNNNNNSNNSYASSKRNGGQLKMDTLRHHQHQYNQQELRHNKQMQMQSLHPSTAPSSGSEGAVALKNLGDGRGAGGRRPAKSTTSGQAKDPNSSLSPGSPRASSETNRKGLSGEPVATNRLEDSLKSGSKLKFVAGGPNLTWKMANNKQQQKRRRKQQQELEQTNRGAKNSTKFWSSTPSSLNSSTSSSRRSVNKSASLAPTPLPLGPNLGQAEVACTSSGEGASGAYSEALDLRPRAEVEVGVEEEEVGLGRRRRSLVWGRRTVRCKSLGSKSNSTSTSTTRDTELTDVTALSSATRLADLDEPPQITRQHQRGRRREGSSVTSSDDDEVDIEESCAYIDDDDDDDVIEGTAPSNEELGTFAETNVQAKITKPEDDDDIPAKQHLITPRQQKPPYACDYTVARCAAPISLATTST